MPKLPVRHCTACWMHRMWAELLEGIFSFFLIKSIGCALSSLSHLCRYWWLIIAPGCLMALFKKKLTNGCPECVVRAKYSKNLCDGCKNHYWKRMEANKVKAVLLLQPVSKWLKIHTLLNGFNISTSFAFRDFFFGTTQHSLPHSTHLLVIASELGFALKA